MSRKNTSSLFVALAIGVCTGLLLPALIIGGLLIGLREPQVAQQTQERDLQAKIDVLASSLPELLWNLDQVAAREVVAAIMKSPEVVRVAVSDATQGVPFIEMRLPERQMGQLIKGERDIFRGSSRIGHLEIEIAHGGFGGTGVGDADGIEGHALRHQRLVSCLRRSSMTNSSSWE